MSCPNIRQLFKYILTRPRSNLNRIQQVNFSAFRPFFAFPSIHANSTITQLANQDDYVTPTRTDWFKMDTATTPAVLLLDLPKSALAGIDLLSFTVTPRFRGIKNLPPGLHFVFTGSSTAFSVRHGIWFRVLPKDPPSGHQLAIFRWQPETELLATEGDEAERLRWRANIGEFWREGLTPYRQTSGKDGAANDESEVEESNDWPQLTGYITDDLLARITQARSATDDWHLTSASSAKRDLDVIPGLSADESNVHPEKALQFLHIDLQRTWREGATGRERTDAAQDRSWALNELITTHCADSNGMDIVGELQFCFLMVLTLNNWSCLEQWKRLLTLLFTCKAACVQLPDLFIRALATLRLQLIHCKDAEGGLIDLADEGGSLLKSLLVRFRKGLETLPSLEIQDILDELDDLEAYLQEEHGWQLGGSFVRTGLLELEDGEQVGMDTTAYDEDDELGEYAPQIVDLTPEQAKLLGVELGDGGDLRKRLQETSLDAAVKSAEVDAANRHDRKAVIHEVDDSSDDDENEEDEEEVMEDLDDMDARY